MPEGTTSDRRHRLFFALWPTPDERAALTRAARETLDQVSAAGGRLIAEENWHLTLLFLGAVREAELARVLDAVHAVRAAPFDLALDRLSHWRRPELLCATASEPPAAAAQLAGALQEALLAAGFTPDVKRFHVHVTLARQVGSPVRERQLSGVEWRAREFSLIESRPTPAGSTYSVQKAWPLYAGA